MSTPTLAALIVSLVHSCDALERIHASLAPSEIAFILLTPEIATLQSTIDGLNELYEEQVDRESDVASVTTQP